MPSTENRLPRFTILLPLACLAINGLFLFCYGRIPIADTYAGTLISHFFSSNVDVKHGLPLWAPYLAWGVDASVHYFASVPPFYLLLSLVGRIIPGMTELHAYLASMLVLTWVLFLGTWLLARRLFRSPWAVTLTCVSVQFLANFSPISYAELTLIAAIPFTLYTLERAISERDPTIALWGLVFQVFFSLHGAALYFVIAQALFCLAFAAALTWEKRVSPLALARRLSRRDWLPFLALILLVVFPFVLLLMGERHHIDTIGRSAEGGSTFASYADGLFPLRLTNLLTVATGTDLSFRSWYVGYLAVPLILVGGALGVTRRMAGPVFAGLFIFLFACGGASFVGPALYLVPGMSYFRNPGIAGALVRLALVFVAAYGIDAILSENAERARRARLAVAAILVVTTLILWKTRAAGSSPERFLLVSVVLRLMTAVTLVGSCFHPKLGTAGRLMPVVCALAAVEALSFRSVAWQYYSVPASSRTWHAYGRRPLPFLPQRTTTLVGAPRFEAMYEVFYPNTPFPDAYRKCSDEKRYCPEWLKGDGTLSDQYANINQFFEMEACFTPLMEPLQSRAVAATRALVGKRLADEKTFSSLSEDVRRTTACEFPKFQLWESDPATEAPHSVAFESSVGEFHPNHVTVRLTAPASRDRYWLYYSDAWHPGWKATVDGKPAPVVKTRDGFKAVAVPAGPSTVQWDFARGMRHWLLLSELLWSILGLAALWKISTWVRRDVSGAG